MRSKQQKATRIIRLPFLFLNLLLLSFLSSSLRFCSSFLLSGFDFLGVGGGAFFLPCGRKFGYCCGQIFLGLGGQSFFSLATVSTATGIVFSTFATGLAALAGLAATSHIYDLRLQTLFFFLRRLLPRERCADSSASWINLQYKSAA